MFRSRKSIQFTIVFIAIVFIWVSFNSKHWNSHSILNWDMYGYSMYLSSVFIYDDVKHLQAFENIDSIYRPTGDLKGYARHEVGNGNSAFKYTCGNAVMYSPFYLSAHIFTLLTKKYRADGYSVPYQFSVAMSSLFWSLLALWILGNTLIRWYKPVEVSIVLIILALGTNLLYYATLEAGHTHIASFFWFALTLYSTFKWFDSFRWKYALLLGICIGMIALIRLPDMLFCLVPGILFIHQFFKSNSSLKYKLIRQAAIAAMVSLFIFSIQLIYWKYVTGSWFHYSYQDEKFDFLHPYIIDGLFSYKKGWLLYTPVMIFAIVGIPQLLKKNLRLGVTVLIFLCVNIYIVFSWEQWWYGGSFSCRALIQAYAVLAIPLAAFISNLNLRDWKYAVLKRKIAIGVTYIVVFLTISLNLFQTYQYKRGFIHWEVMDKERYWAVFGKYKW